jgi:hypothetical protein
MIKINRANAELLMTALLAFKKKCIKNVEKIKINEVMRNRLIHLINDIEVLEDIINTQLRRKNHDR